MISKRKNLSHRSIRFNWIKSRYKFIKCRYEVLGVDSKNDLRITSNAFNLFNDFKPTMVFHLAAKVGGIHAN